MNYSKPRVIILMHYLELGGAEMSLIGLLSALDPEKIDVDLFVYSHQGPLMQYIPDWVNLLPEMEQYSVIERPIKYALKRGYLRIIAGRLMAKLKHRLFIKKNNKGDTYSSLIQYVGDYVTPYLPAINPSLDYDLCISFLTPHNIGRDKIRAKKRIAWIHTDYSTVNIDTESEMKVWKSYDEIISISPQVSLAFINKFPLLSAKIREIENILPENFIRKRSEDFNVKDELIGDIKFLSIGRFCTAKNYDNVPAIASRLINTNYPELKWYIIGSGIDEELIKRKIAEFGMENHVILLGKKENPYPYIKACDIYVQPSRYEGKSVTVREAQILGKPVAVTAYPTAPSQIQDGVDGVIVPLDNEGCARGLAEFIANKTLQNKIVAYLKTHDYANVSEVDKIYELLK